MEKEFQNQIAVVTGGNSGIGRSICLDLAEKGAKVIILGRNEQKNQETKEAIEAKQGYAEWHKVDVADEKQVQAVFRSIHEKHSAVDLLICNAGIAPPPAFGANISSEAFDNLLKVHVHGTLYCVQACAEKMKEKKYGRIIIMSSVAGIFGLTGNINYAVAKTGLVGMTYTLAKELGPYGITVNAIQPGAIRTSMTEIFLNVMEEKVAKSTPVSRIGEPEDIAHAVAFFCSRKSSFITGSVLRIDGGYILNSSIDKLMFQLSETPQ